MTKLNAHLKDAAAIALVLFGAMGSVAVSAADRMTLNLVWARVADVNGEQGSVETAQFSPDSRFIVSGSKFDNQVIMWRVSDGSEIWRRALPQEIEKIVWTRDGRHVASVSEDRVLRLMRADTGAIVNEVPHEQGIDSVEVSKNGRWLATGQEYRDLPGGKREGVVRIFSLPALTEVARVDHGATVNEMDFTPDDAMLVTAGDNSEARLWKTSDWTMAHRFAPTEGDRRDGFVTTKVSPDGNMVAVAGFGGDVHVWRLADKARVRRINLTGRKVESVTWSPDGRALLMAGHDSAIAMLRTRDITDTGLEHDEMPVVRVPVPDNMEFIQFNALGSLLASSHQDGTIRLWTYMSDDPSVNTRRHNAVRQQQDEAARAKGAKQ